MYSNSNFFGYISNRPKKLCNDFFWGTEDLILVQLTLIIQKISKKVDFCHFFRDVLSLGWGGIGVLWCNRLNYSLQMGQIWPIMTQNDWLWPRMTYQGSWGHQGVQGGARGHQGAPGGSRLPPAPKREIKQQNNGPKSWFKVPKVCPDPKGMVFTHFWGIWGHLDGLKQPYLVKTPICQKPSFRKKMILPLTQTTGCNFRNIRQFSIKANILGPYGKLSKNPIM